MIGKQPNNPLHDLSLEQIVVKLVEHHGWDGLAEKININCFKNDPTVKSSLKFLRKTPWAREQVEKLYIAVFASGSAQQSGRQLPRRPIADKKRGNKKCFL